MYLLSYYFYLTLAAADFVRPRVKIIEFCLVPTAGLVCGVGRRGSGRFFGYVTLQHETLPLKTFVVVGARGREIHTGGFWETKEGEAKLQAASRLRSLRVVSTVHGEVALERQRTPWERGGGGVWEVKKKRPGSMRSGSVILIGGQRKTGGRKRWRDSGNVGPR